MIFGPRSALSSTNGAKLIYSGLILLRKQWLTYVSYSTIITGFIYPVVSHWGWSGTGWLQNHGIESMARHKYNETTGELMYDGDNAVGYVDFAGSGLVHCTGGRRLQRGRIFYF